MTEEERLRRREERRRNRKPSIGFVTSHYAIPPSDEEDYWCPPYYYQVARTMGLRHYDHPELEALITYSVDDGGYSLLKYLARRVREGERFAAGDRVEIPHRYPAWGALCTVEFRESRDVYGPCLRAVVLGMEEEYQALSSEEADRWLLAHGPLYDPYEGL